jgi:hypothetical protein
MARKFLYFIAGCIVLVIATLVVLRVWSSQLTDLAFVPKTRFVAPKALTANAYDDPAMWYARPGTPGEALARWQPLYDKDSPAPKAAPEPAPPAFAVFFIHPTSYLERAHWNAPLGDKETEKRARLFVRGMASPFNQASQIWAPRYRQATLGAFLKEGREANEARALAYRDIAQAFDAFLRKTDPAMPIVLVGHSQGSFILLNLLKDRIAGTPLARRVVAAYVVGWPISVEHDLPLLGLPACTAPGQSGCVMSWGSYAEPADPGDRLHRYADSTGLDGKKRGKGAILCANPLTGGAKGAAPASANLGSLKADADLKDGKLVARGVPARCDKRGLLLIGDPPEMGAYVLPGNDYHVYDIPLFWRNLQVDVAGRVRAWRAAR